MPAVLPLDVLRHQYFVMKYYIMCNYVYKMMSWFYSNSFTLRNKLLYDIIMTMSLFSVFPPLR